jgi:hypothetical protein
VLMMLMLIDLMGWMWRSIAQWLVMRAVAGGDAQVADARAGLRVLYA